MKIIVEKKDKQTLQKDFDDSQTIEFVKTAIEKEYGHAIVMIQNITGQTIKRNVDASHSLADVTSEIEEQHGIPLAKQQIVFSCFEGQFYTDIALNMFSGTCVTLKVANLKTLGNVKAKIQNMFGIARDRQ